MPVVYAEVAVPRIAPDTLTYSVPEQLVGFVTEGVRVRVPVRRRTATGIVVAISDETELDPTIIKPVADVLDSEPLLPGHLFHLARFIASYYRSPLGTALATILPASLLRADSETAVLTLAGAAADREKLGPRQAALLEILQGSPRTGVPSLLARAGAKSRSPLDALAAAGLVRLQQRRRDRAPRVEVTGLQLARRPLDELLHECRRAPRQREVIEWLASLGRPALLSEARAAIGCSPSTIRALAERGAIDRFTQRSPRRPRWTLQPPGHRHRLTDEQQSAVQAIASALQEGGYAPFLLDGVTGSGKTEVYLHCLERVIAAGRTGLVLVPEIGLTPAASGAVERRFGSQAAVLHSAQSEGERGREWQRVQDGEARIVVGPRSALFAPVRDLGLIIIDEEHDAAYKQQETPRYNARDLALVLGQHMGVPVVLCSATPSVESAALVLRDRAKSLRLTRRVAGGMLPDVELVDLRREPPEPGEQGRTLFSARLRDAMTETIAAGDQVILLMQRRGWAPVLLCRDCGSRIQCPSCSVSMVVHRRGGGLRCHYCGHHAPHPPSCPACSGTLLDAIGAGTEKVAHHLSRMSPEVTVSILDRDTVRRRHGLHDTLGAFAEGKVQVLVGTQLVAKGHHFPNVTLTGVISADAMLGLPDFRSSERTFQLLTQVAGRAGRGAKPGRVIIQTYYPDHPAVRHASRHDVASFVEEEMIFRRAFSYPPATRMAVVRWESRIRRDAMRVAEESIGSVRPVPAGVRIRGPAPAPIEKIRSLWRWQVLVTAPNRDLVRDVLAKIEIVPLPDSVRRVIDVDPLSTL
jgi:primosomal protein N' (replication factor Y)